MKLNIAQLRILTEALELYSRDSDDIQDDSDFIEMFKDADEAYQKLLREKFSEKRNKR